MYNKFNSVEHNKNKRHHGSEMGHPAGEERKASHTGRELDRMCPGNMLEKEKQDFNDKLQKLR